MVNQRLMNAIGEVMLAIERDDFVIWPMLVINELEATAEGSAFEWAVAAVNARIANLPDEEKARHERWMAELAEALQASNAAEDLAERCRAIWYDQPAGGRTRLERNLHSAADSPGSKRSVRHIRRTGADAAQRRPPRLC